MPGAAGDSSFSAALRSLRNCRVAPVWGVSHSCAGYAAGMPWGDRYDTRGALIGIAVVLIGGVGIGIGLQGGLAPWLVSIAIACGVMNLTSHLLRVRAKRSVTPDGQRSAQPITAAEFRRRLPIVAAGVSTAVLVAVAWTLALGKSGTVPSAISGAVIAALMLFVMLRRRPIR